MKKRLITSPEQMIELGQKIGSDYHKVLLHGELGAGKTHFTKWFVRNFWIKSDAVQSPTYVYYHEYNKEVLHCDLYRVKDQAILVERGIFDQIDQYENIIIERPCYEELYADNSWIVVEITKTTPSQREVVLRSYIIS